MLLRFRLRRLGPRVGLRFRSPRLAVWGPIAIAPIALVFAPVMEYRGTNFVLVHRAILKGTGEPKAAGARREGTAFQAKD